MDKNLTETVNKMAESATKAGLTVPDITDIVPNEAESVIESSPAVIELEPKTLKLVQEFSWNFNEIKAALSSRITQYTGLVVTDENLKDMEKTKREIVSLRTKIGKFRLSVKRDMDKPYQQFELQIDELSKLVESVEKPLSDQIEKYEIKRRDEKTLRVKEIIKEVAAQCGLGEKYSSQIAVADKYLNKGTSIAEITEDIQMRVAWFLDVQNQEQQAAFFKAEKVEMAKLLCQSLSAGLISPVTFEEIESRIDSMPSILALKSHIENEVARRKEREDRAAQQALEREEKRRLAAAAPPSPPAPPVMPPKPQPTTPPLPQEYQKFPFWDVLLRLPAIDVPQAIGFKDYLAANNIRYEIVSQERSVDI
ncbi:DUF1351 domain-containing protein [Anaerospora hongkongensis]|uniref:DUF1351 domain-containing protein n=1 Tax=Anaerospora hongkongensis TaxID=244830 RepID=UPI002FDAB214